MEELESKIREILGDAISLSILCLRLEKQGHLTLFSLYTDVETLISLFNLSGRLFTEGDIRSLYRKYFRGERPVEGQPGVRHHLKVVRSKSTKGQLETATQYITYLRRVQSEILSVIQESLKEFFFANPRPCEARLSGSAVVDLTTGSLLSGRMQEIVQWLVLGTGSECISQWMSLLLTFRRFMGLEDLLGLLADCAEFGIDILPDWCSYAARLQHPANNLVRVNATKMLLLHEMLMSSQGTDGHAQVANVNTMVLERAHRFISVAPSLVQLKSKKSSEANDLGSDDVSLTAMLNLHQSGDLDPPSLSVSSIEDFIQRWKSLVDAQASSKSDASFNVLEVSAATMARQLTFADCAMLWNLKVDDMLSFCGLAVGDAKADGGVFRLFERRFDRLVWVIVSMICWSDTPLKLLDYWITVEIELERLGNFQSLMVVNCALSHYLVEGMKKIWPQVAYENFKQHQRLLQLFTPTNNYKEYRARLKDKCAKALAHWFAGSPGSNTESKDDSFFILATPVLQRDVVLANEMPTTLELLPGTLNWQKLKILGECVSRFFLSRVTASRFLGKEPRLDDALMDQIVLLPWTDDEDLLFKVSRRTNDAHVPAGLTLKPIVKQDVNPALNLVSPGRSGYLPPPPMPMERAESSHTDDNSETTGDEGGGVTFGGRDSVEISVQNPLVVWVGENPKRAARAANLIHRAEKKFVPPSLAKAGSSSALPQVLISPRGIVGGGPPKLVRQKTDPKIQSISPGGAGGGATGVGGGGGSNLGIKWCVQCQSRKTAPNSQLCADCLSPAEVSSQPILTHLVLIIHVAEDTDPSISIKRNATWPEVQYVIKCELGQEVLDQGIACKTPSGDLKPIREANDWDLLLLRAKEESSVKLYVMEAQQQMVGMSPTNTEEKRGKKNWFGTFKRGLSLQKVQNMLDNENNNNK